MKATKNGIVLTSAALVFVTGLAMMTMRSTAYDEQAHRAEITAIYPAVHWSEYRDAARDVCELSEGSFRLVAAMAHDDGLKATQAMLISTAYLCPERLKSLER